MSDTKTTKQSLFEEFPPISRKEWEKVIEQDLKGADYKEKLRWHTGEGVNPLPFYRRDDFQKIDRKSPIAKKYRNDRFNSWEIREAIFASSISTANDSARKALECGADALQFHLNVRRTEGMLGGDLQGLPIQNQQDFSDLLDGISLENTALHFDSGLASPVLLAMLWNEVKNQNLDSETILTTFSYDPFVYMLQHGQHPKDSKNLNRDLIQIDRFTTENLPGVRPLCIDGRLYHNAGGTIVQELGLVLAVASEYLSLLTDGGIDINEVTNALHFSFAIGSNYFLEIAKLRAARLLWKNLLGAYGAEPNETYLHGETSQWNKTLYDPYTNMLRTSTEGMSGAIGGCDSMTILPFDQHFREPNKFSERIARNQQLILSEESHLDKVGDPAAGSYYVEKLTEDIGRKAWKLFRDIETEGGLFQAIENGTVQSAIQDSQQKRDQAIASRGRIFVGTNQYSNAEDNMAAKMASTYQTVSLNKSEEAHDFDIQNIVLDLASALDDGATIGDLVGYLFDVGKHYIRTVNPYRGAQAFEKLRLATEKHEMTPKVLALPLGNKSWRKGRSTFTSNFFGCAGYKIEDPIGFEDVDAAMEVVKEQQPDAAVICSSDKEYKELVPAFTKAFETLDDRPILVLAGYPKDDVEVYKRAGIDEFIYAKCNVLETLTRFQHKLGIIKNDK